MKEESVKRFLEAADDTFKVIGFPSFVDGIHHVRVGLENLRMFLGQVESRSKAVRLLKKIPEPDPKELEEGIAMLRRFVFDLRKLLPEAFRSYAKRLPHPPGGRPASLTREERKEVCRCIGNLLSEGVTLKAAQNRLVQRNGVSLRTIQRAWRERKQLFAPAGE